MCSWASATPLFGSLQSRSGTGRFFGENRIQRPVLVSSPHLSSQHHAPAHAPHCSRRFGTCQRLGVASHVFLLWRYVSISCNCPDLARLIVLIFIFMHPNRAIHSSSQTSDSGYSTMSSDQDGVNCVNLKLPTHRRHSLPRKPEPHLRNAIVRKALGYAGNSLP